MSTAFNDETRAREEATNPLSSDQDFASPPLTSTPGQTDEVSPQALLGNASVANAQAGPVAITPGSDPRQLQTAYGNSVVARVTEGRQPAAASAEPRSPEKPPGHRPPESKPESPEAEAAEKAKPFEAAKSKPPEPSESGPFEAAKSKPFEALKSKPTEPSESKSFEPSESKPGEIEAATPPEAPVKESTKQGGPETSAPEVIEEETPEESAERAIGAADAGKEEEKKETGKKPSEGKEPAPKKVDTAAPPTGGEKVSGGGTAGLPAAEEPAPVAITAKEPGGILEQLTTVPPAQAAAAYQQAESVSAAALENQKEEAQESLPKIPAPTGLLPKESVAKEKADATGAATKTPPTEPGAEKKGRDEEPYETGVEAAPRAPLPPPTDLKVRGKTDEEKAAEMARSAQAVLNSVFIDTTEVSTSGGERPSVDTTGEADPSQMDTANQESTESVRTGKLEAAADISKDYGENDIFPEPTDEILEARKALSAASPAAGGAMDPLALPPEAVAGLNASLGPVFAERIGTQKKEYDAGEEKYDQDRVSVREQADAEIAELEGQARETQTAEQTRAKEEVGGAREEWRTELDKVEKDYEEKADQAGKDQRTKIVDEKTKGEKDAAKHLEDAEKKAADEKKQAEQKAADEKQKGKKKSGGFWGWARRAASALIDGIKAAVNFIYDTLRKAVKLIFEAAKALALAAIELARMAVVGLIKAYGAILKGLVSVVFFAFPDIKKKINSKIDKAVDLAVKGVNTAADLLKKGVAAVLDFVANAIDSLLGLIQSLYNGLFTLIGMIIRGEFQELMRRIGYLIDAAKTAPEQFETAALEELLGGNLDEPLSPAELMQAGVAPPSLGAEGGATAEGAGPSELPAPPWNEGNIGVDEVDPNMELSPELAEELLERTNGEGEVELASSEDESRTMTSVMSEVSPETAGTSPEEVRYPDDGLNPTQRAEIKWKLMKEGIAKWWDDNWPTVLAAAAAAILGFIALNIVTGGAITAALPVIMGIVGPLFAGLTILQLAEHAKKYIELGWEGQIRPAGKSLAKGLAAGAIELISWLTFKAGGAALKGAKALVKGGIKLAKAGAKMIARGAKFLISKGKVLFQGIARSGIGRMFTKLKAMGEGLLKRLRFKKFRILLSGRWFTLEGFINPWVTIAKGEIKVVKKGTKKSVFLSDDELKAIKEGEVPKVPAGKGAAPKKKADAGKLKKTEPEVKAGAESESLLGSNGKFKASDLEEAYQRYVVRKIKAGEVPRKRADWKETSDFWTKDSPMARGNKFNKTANKNYPHDEVHLENGKRLDAYDPKKGEIVSRKATDFDDIETDTFKRHLKEMKDKYSAGTKIRSDKYPNLDGKKLKGKLILEVPKTNEVATNKKLFERLAKAEGIEIRYTPE